jgi:hypothetical protein
MGGQRIRVTKDGGYSAFESSDGQMLRYSKQSKGEQIGIWEKPLRGGPERRIVEPTLMRNFDVTNRGIYFVPRTAGPPFVLRFLDFKTHSVSDIMTFNQQLYSTLSVSSDERWLLYSTVDKEDSDLMLVENFH